MTAKKKSLSVEDMIAEAEKHITEDTHALLRSNWMNVRDELVQVLESEKRYDLLYGDGRVTEGKGKDENLPRETENRVEES